ncbi:MAG: hypothetical protein U9Q22_05275 [Candidatus Altiarchaeota archaeon]|nr:hypothetical protein [Candidatus Altiarchaeota archaeon]
MTKKLVFVSLMLITLLSLNFAESATNELYLLDINYNKYTLNLIDVSVKQGYAPDRMVQPEEGYRCEVISFTNEVVYTFKFEIPSTLCSDYIDPKTGRLSGGCIKVDNVNFTLQIPYFRNAKTIRVYDPHDFPKLSVDVSRFAKLCNDSICEPHENYQNCPQDCPSGGEDDYCDKVDDGICDPDCSPQEDLDCVPSTTAPTPVTEKLWGIGYLPYIALLLVITVLVFAYRRIRS